MRKMHQQMMPGVPPSIQAIFNEIFKASQEADVVDIGAEYRIEGTFTETRVLDVDTPTAANVANVLATLLNDLRNGGARKST